ncbi:thioredoxin family protein [Bradyrhizobium erythrophlei]|uniref:thioredoxin family protein n=1 Tax=Bradyrhizobium erythrophlei TaxID=1437360 RepID=UPI0035EA96EF
MKVEIFYTPGCSECAATHAKLRTAAQEAVGDVEWHELNVLDELDRATDLGVITLPSIVVDGELVFTSMPSVEQLRTALIERTKGRE